MKINIVSILFLSCIKLIIFVFWIINILLFKIGKSWIKNVDNCLYFVNFSKCNVSYFNGIDWNEGERLDLKKRKKQRWTKSYDQNTITWGHLYRRKNLVTDPNGRVMNMRSIYSISLYAVNGRVANNIVEDKLFDIINEIFSNNQPIYAIKRYEIISYWKGK